NGVADFLASLAVQTERNSEFSVSGALPLAGRLILQQDQSRLPTVRLKRMIAVKDRELDDVFWFLNWGLFRGRRLYLPVGLVS
ncbi:unnamed protein product, partial [Ilex paraguariensis]